MQQTPFTGAGSKPSQEKVLALAEVGDLVSSFGFFGVIWLNRELVVEDTYGRLVDFVRHAEPLNSSVLPVIGLEGEILGLKDHPDRVLELPAVGIASENGDNGKLNFTFFWNRGRDMPMAIAYRSTSQTELEFELSKQIRARLMAEAEVTATSKALARANTDLESFAAIISHDLKAPLRHMRYLADTLVARTTENDIAATLAGIKAQAERMSSMLSSLLNYSSIGRKYEAIEPIDTSNLVTDIVASLPQTGIEISVLGEWPTISTLKAPLDLVLRNLIANALQHHDLPDGAVTITCTDTKSGLAITIADDGPGIDQKHHDAIFLPFRTLAPEGAAQSTGMGLAMVKKTVEGTGGSISIKSDPGNKRGTVFTVLWPKNVAI